MVLKTSSLALGILYFIIGHILVFYQLNGQFIWRGKIIPLFPELKGINWLKGKATKKYQKI